MVQLHLKASTLLKFQQQHQLQQQIRGSQLTFQEKFHPVHSLTHILLSNRRGHCVKCHGLGD